jgi:hypothetical protein
MFDGAVLHDDGMCILVVSRRPELVMVISLNELGPEAVFRIGHALGNRHSPAELHGNEILVPVTDTPDLVARSVQALGLRELTIRFEERPLRLQDLQMVWGLHTSTITPSLILTMLEGNLAVRAGPLLSLMQLADSALPIGEHAHAFGLERMLRDKRVTTPDALREMIVSALIHGSARARRCGDRVGSYGICGSELRGSESSRCAA